MASSGRNTPTSKPAIAPKPPSGRPMSMVNTSNPPERRKHNKKQMSTQSEYRGSMENIPPHMSLPPPLPPSLPSSAAPKYNTISQPTRKHQHSANQNGIQLATLVDSAKSLPVAATVSTGMYGQLSESSLYEERVIIHFEMRLKVIEATVEKGGTYQIPLCTANKFSLLHNPTNNTAQAIMGHYYETVGHILAQPLKPKVVCATRSFNSATPEASVQEGDILFLSPNIRTKAFKSGKYLKCYNVTNNEEKLLHENCVGGFTTQPELIKMSLKDIWESKYTNPPLKVIMYHQLPHVVLVKHIQVTLLSEVWEDSVIATRDHIIAPQNESIYGNVQLLRFVKDVGINVLPDKEEIADIVVYKAYCEETCHLFNEFDYSRIQIHLFNEDPVWPNHEEIQSSLYSNISRHEWERFVLLKKPESAFKFLKRRKSTKNNYSVVEHEPSVSSTQQSTTKANKMELVSTDKQGDYQLLKPVTKEELIGVQVDEIVPEIPDVASLLHEVNTVNRQMMIQVEGLRAEVEGLKMELKQTKNMMLTIKRDLTSSISEIRTDISSIAHHDNDNDNDEYVAMEISPEKENIQILKEFTPEQVLQALEKLKLTRCKDEFQKRRISGADLAKCNAETLENNLGVRNQLDILRLMKFIEGCPTIWKMLENSS